MNHSVAYLGPLGTFTYEAAIGLFPNKNAKHIPYPTIPDVLLAVEQREVDYAVVPVENAIEGSVHTTWDWLIHHVHVPIVAEWVHPISHCLIIHPSQANGKDELFTKIISHPQAIAQCQIYLKKRFPKARFHFADSTAQAVNEIAEHPDEPWIAIGTEKAAAIYQLWVKEKNIQDHPNNFTRFYAIGRKPYDQGESFHMKTCFQVVLPSDYPGALHQVLAAFAWRKINLTHIESRPTKTGLGNYFFIIDAVLPVEHVLLTGAMQEIEALGCQVRVLGSFPCFQGTDSIKPLV